MTCLRSSLVVAKIFCSSQRTEHRGSCSTLQLHWTYASTLEECVATSAVCSSTCDTWASTISDTVLHLWDHRGWVVGTWCCAVIGTPATLSVTFQLLSSRTVKYEFLPAVGTALLLLLGMLFSPAVGRALSPSVGPLFPAVVALVISQL